MTVLIVAISAFLLGFLAGNDIGMIRDRAPIFIALSDLLCCLLVYVLIAVNPVKAKTDGIKPPVLFLVSMSWDIQNDTDIDLWYVGPTRKPVFYGFTPSWLR